MRWSVSASRVFYQCPRKWYYDHVFADSSSNDELRRQAFALKQLNSIHAWRGKLVDYIISEKIIPSINNGNLLEQNAALSIADDLMDRQLSPFDGSSAGAMPECSFFEREYEGGLQGSLVETARKEALQSLRNFYSSSILTDLVNSSSYLIAQRTLQFSFSDLTVSATPDVIAFFRDRNPAIIDWKVEAPANKEHWIQLAVYAWALSKVTPHKDFRAEWLETIKDPSKTGLIEFQLLRNKLQEYIMTAADIIDVEDYIYTSFHPLRLLLNGGKLQSLKESDFPTAKLPETCLRCKYRRICWRDRT